MKTNSRTSRIASALAVPAMAATMAAAGTLPAQAADSANTQELYRLYNKTTAEHIYTASAHEAHVLIARDWTYEGVAWSSPTSSSTPVYRLYNPILKDHHFTTSTNEVKVLTSGHGWLYEGVGWYSADSGNVTVNRLFNSKLQSGSHHFTTDTNEYNSLTSYAWNQEGMAWKASAAGSARALPADPDPADTAKQKAAYEAEKAAAKAAAEAAAKAAAEAAARKSSDPKQIAHTKVLARGWGEDQYSCLVSLWQKESGWRTNAANSSGAYGIPQALPGSKMASVGADWRTNPATQIEWGLGYISGRYGTPCSAWNFFRSHNWY